MRAVHPFNEAARDAAPESPIWLLPRYNNQLTDAGALALAASIPFCQKLTDVDISFERNVSAAGFAAVSAALEGPRHAAPPSSVPAFTATLAATHVSLPAAKRALIAL